MPSTTFGSSRCSSGSPPAMETTGAPHSSTAARQSATLTGADSGSRRDSRSCRSPRRRDCSGTAARASVPGDSACAAPGAGEGHRRRHRPFAEPELPLAASFLASVYRHVQTRQERDSGFERFLAARVEQLAWQAELDVFDDARQQADLDRGAAPQRLDQILDQRLGRRGAGGDARPPPRLRPSWDRAPPRCRPDSWARPSSRPISRSRLELELLLAPTTRITSASLLSSRTAVCRFWVA